MSTTSTTSYQYDRLMHPILIAGCLIIMISFAIRSSFGLFQIPVAGEFGWLRSEFSLAIAIQNLFWGIGQPMFGALAEKYGDRKAIVAGIFCYALGLFLSAFAITPGQHQLLEMVIGFGIAGTGFGLILAIVGRATSDRHRSVALGITTAAGSVGQLIGPPVAQSLLASMPWQEVFMVFAGIILVTLLFVKKLKVPKPTVTSNTAADEPLGVVVKRAVKDPTFIFLFVGFFSCGYQLAFITAHFPALITEMCSAISPASLIQSLGVTTTSGLGAMAIALIGLANIGGTILAGLLGNRYSRKYLLASIYALRTLISVIFIMNPITPEAVVLFSILMGALWLATVPLTAGLIGHIYGLKYMGTLYGLVFLSHQIGGFLGVWLGGALYDYYGDYIMVWWIGIAVGLFSALIHLPVNERPQTAVAVT
ncbi:MFS transporter [Alteromonas sp. LMIT006]|uniref:MFS transporter n=1 Tax=Alteromonadaceae TaxID=72275 RepID=UPI0020CA3EDA|nr:MFS transporter [Alteromonas sp. LMIT006]UTP73237.1 MFS transporter [Alteromonas sp. LMIT006]